MKRTTYHLIDVPKGEPKNNYIKPDLLRSQWVDLINDIKGTPINPNTDLDRVEAMVREKIKALLRSHNLDEVGFWVRFRGNEIFIDPIAPEDAYIFLAILNPKTGGDGVIKIDLNHNYGGGEIFEAHYKGSYAPILAIQMSSPNNLINIVIKETPDNKFLVHPIIAVKHSIIYDRLLFFLADWDQIKHMGTWGDMGIL